MIRQLDSPLCKLPFELRKQIFDVIILDISPVVHIFKLPNKDTLCYWRCTSAIEGQPCSWDTPCSICLPYGSRYLNNDGTWIMRGQENCLRTYRSDLAAETISSWNLLSLLCTCREIYSELTPLIYSTLYFHFPNAEDILHFCLSIIPSRLNTMTKLSFDLGWTFHRPSQPQPWSDELWKLLSKMKGLRELKVYVKKFFSEDGEEPLYLQFKEGVRRIKGKGLDFFEAVVPGEQRELWGGFVEEGVDIKVILLESPVEPIDPFS